MFTVSDDAPPGLLVGRRAVHGGVGPRPLRAPGLDDLRKERVMLQGDYCCSGDVLRRKCRAM
ncbi:hypothetical protein [Streptomyces atratus]|uniref:hypothetical protein n=1 Tax=Streptomyces atratus TaxID=1893 RepID=UPI0033D15C51